MSDAKLTPQQQFAADVEKIAVRELIRMAGDEQGRRAAARVALSIRSLAQRNPRVYDCTPASVGVATALCALTGLMPGGPYPECDIIPRDRKFKQGDGWGTVTEATWQIGYRGAIRLALRAGYRVAPYPVYEGAPVTLDSAGRLVIPTTRQRVDRSFDRLIGCIVTIHDVERDRYIGSEWIDADAIEARRACSEAWRQAQEGLAANAPAWKRENALKSPWIAWSDEMVRKTAIRYVVARGLVPVDDTFGHALEADSRADIIDVEPPKPAAKAEPRALPDHGALAELERDLTGSDAAEAVAADIQRDAGGGA